MIDTVGRPTIITHELTSGVIVHITPLTAQAVMLLKNKANDRYPNPDPKPYEERIEGAVVETAVIPAEQNPEYVRLRGLAQEKRTTYMREFALEKCVTYPEGKAEIIARKREFLEGFRELDPDLNLDDWQTVLDLVVASSEEQLGMAALALRAAPVEPHEVADGIRYFRPLVSRRGSRDVLPTDELPSRPE